MSARLTPTKAATRVGHTNGGARVVSPPPWHRDRRARMPRERTRAVALSNEEER